jgi:lysophospholipase L1-like esterase
LHPATKILSTIAILAMLGSAHAREMPTIRVVLIGDSTMAPRSGYGDALCARFDSTDCINLAKGGRSSKSYRSEGLWDQARARFKAKPQPEVYVLIQFGHNDQPGKAERSTTLPEFAANMTQYVEEVRSDGAVPILVTPLTRRMFKDGLVTRDLEEWAQATRDVAKQTGALLLDLNADSTAAVQKMGAMQATALAQGSPSPEVAAAALTGTTIEAPKPAHSDPANPPFDYTHLGENGADLFAAIVADEIRSVAPRLGAHLKR